MYQIDFKKPIHVFFMGIGGISMSGLAEILLSEGFRVSGSDRQRVASNRGPVRKRGCHLLWPEKENLASNPDLIVYTSAIKKDNPEFIAGHELGIPFLTRAYRLDK